MTRCSATVWDGWRHHQCSRMGVLVENGEPWCKQHAPSSKKAKRAEQEMIDEQRRQSARRYAEARRREENFTKECVGLVRKLAADGCAEARQIMDQYGEPEK